MNRKRVWLSAGGAAMATALITTFLVLSAGPATSKQFATLDVLAGSVDVRSAGQSDFRGATDGATLKEGDTVRTADDGRAEIEYFDGSITRLDYDTTFAIEELASLPDEPGSKVIRGAQGSGRTFSRITKLTGSESRVEVGTPTAVAAVRGTAFFIQEIVAVDGTISFVFGVIEGRVLVTPEGGGEPVLVEQGHYVVVDSEGNIGPILELTEEMLAQDWILYNQCDLDGVPLAACQTEEETEEPTQEETQEEETQEQEQEDVDQPLDESTPPPEDGGPPGGPQGGPQGPPDDPPPDTTPPDTTITKAPPALDISQSGSFKFVSSENGSTFQCSFDGAAFANCASPRSYNLSDGDHTFRVRAEDAVGNIDPTPAVHEWTIDSTPPVTTITAGPDVLTNRTDATFTFVANEAVQGFECDLDGQGYEPCASPRMYGGLEDGSHTFRVRATDLAGNVESTATWTWTIDTVAPEVTIDEGPQGTVATGTATFSFSSSKPGSTFLCSLNGGAFEPCASPKTYEGLADGPQTFNVQATDLAGNVGASELRVWTVDTTPPVATIDSGPAALANSASAIFSFSSEPGATFECSLDGAAFQSCSSPEEHQGLSDGSHVFAVRATDTAGNVGIEALHAWTIDTVAPGVTIDSGPQGAVSSTEATLTFSSEPGATFECELDGAGFTSCASPRTYEGLAQGNHTFSVRATDEAGNTSAPASRAWTVDTTAPDVEILTGPDAPTNATGATFTFAAEEGATTECSLDEGEFGSCDSPQSYQGLVDGDHTFTVVATDAAGNTATDSFGWRIDTQAPDVAITSAPSDPTSSTEATFTFTAEEGAATECDLDGAGFAPCDSPTAYEGLAEGPHTFTVRATDAAGNSATDSVAWTVDLTPPQTAIGDGPDELTNSTEATFTFQADEAVDGFQCDLDGTGFEACDSPKTYEGLADGTHTFSVRATDLAGNLESTATWTWTIDTVAPAATIDDGPQGAVATAAATFSFSSELGATFECDLDGAGFTACSSPQGYAGLADGNHTFSVRAIDEAGNTGAPASRAWTVDTVPPEVEITSGPQALTNQADASFTFTAEEGAATECDLDGAGFAPCGSGVAYTELGEGPHTFTVRATDAAGNSATDSFGWTVDTTPPAVGITSGPASPTNAAEAILSFTAEEGASTECDLDGTGFASCASPTAYEGLGDGEHTFTVRATDAAGNSAEDSHTWTIDTVAPGVTIDDGPQGAVSSAEATFTFSSEPGATFECSLDDAGFEACASPAGYGGLVDGNHTFEVRATDEAGNTGAPASRAWTVDTTGPATTIDDGPEGTVASSEAIFEFSSEPGATFECSLDEAEFDDCASPNGYGDLQPGDHQFQVKATDGAGNTGEPASWHWTIVASDTEAPDTEITSGPSESCEFGEGGLVCDDTSATFEFTSTEDGSTFECRLDESGEGTPLVGEWQECDSPKGYDNLLTGTNYTFLVRATDPAGNTDDSPAQLSWTVVDLTPPQTTITSGPDDPTELTTATFEFTSSEDGSTFQCSLDGGPAHGCVSPQTYEGLAPGPHTFQVWATDPAGNADPEAAVWSWRIGGTGSEITINLTWNNGPRDLDVHVLTPDGGHVFYANMAHPSSGNPWATLDHDVTNGPPGSETITLYPANDGFVSGGFTVYVHNFSCELPFTTSGAVVTVTGGGSSSSLAVSGASGNPTFDTWNVGTLTVDGLGNATMQGTQTIGGTRSCPAGGPGQDQHRGVESKSRGEPSAITEARSEPPADDVEHEEAPQAAITGVEAEVRGSAVEVRWKPEDTPGVVLWSTEEFPTVVQENVGCRGTGTCRIRDLPVGSTVYVTVLAEGGIDQAPEEGVNAIRIEIPAPTQDEEIPGADAGPAPPAPSGSGSSGQPPAPSSPPEGDQATDTTPKPPRPEEPTPPPEEPAVRTDAPAAPGE
ncbi:MAG: Ig-like domain-containing protein [Actinomycetota bacterium]